MRGDDEVADCSQELKAARPEAVGAVLDVLLVVLYPAIEIDLPHQAAERAPPGAGVGHVVDRLTAKSLA
jgi:hypothetical protein